MAEYSPRADTLPDYDTLHSDAYFEGLLNDAPVQVLFFNDCPEQEADAQRDEIKAQIAVNNLPSIGHFTLVIDRSVDFIGADSYAQYFSQWQAPIVAPGLGEEDHDAEHVLGYKRKFQSILFASVAARAAQNALNKGFTGDFTDAMDALGDHCLDIIEGLADWREYADARICLGGLTDFCHFDNPELRDKVYSQLCAELGVSENDDPLAPSNTPHERR